MNKLLLTVAGLAVSAAANAAPVQWTGTGSNGHWYEFVNTSASWTDANAAANAATYFDGSNTLGGYLATITSSNENSFLGTLAGDGWIGLTDEASEGSFLWAGGPEAGTLTFTSWSGGEPNDFFGEDYVQYSGGNWNDLPNGSNRGYFVEYSEAQDVPEPAMLGLFGLGAIGIAASRRRKA